MLYNKYLGMDISRLGFGMMRLPLMPGTQKIDEEQTREMVKLAFEGGVNYFDTAYPYHQGLSEPFIGAALKKYPRESYNLVTKLFIPALKEESDIDRIFNEQLDRCKVDYFDFYLAHALNAERFELIERLHVFERLSEFKAQGKIRHIGFSFHDTPEVLERILAAHDWEFAQIQLNYLDWELQNAERQYELIEQKGIQCTIMEPVRGGMLAVLTPEAIECFKQADPNASAASWAIRFAASKKNVLTVLSGMTNLDHVTDNVNTIENFRPLTKEDEAVIESALAAYRKAVTIPCTGCRYCMDCPSGVDIPKVFAAYNRYATSRSRAMFDKLYLELAEVERAESCVACGSCLPKCPQHIDIPAKMKEIVALAKEG
jgi:predicted aldo/keto reductase-like oxidoreductase